MNGLLNDLRHAARVFSRNPGFAAIVVITLMLGIGVTTAVFSIFNGVLLRPLPFPHQEELVRVYDTQPACQTCPASLPEFNDWKDRGREIFAAIGGATGDTFIITGNGDPLLVNAVVTTASLYDVLGVQPILGRWYTTQENQPDGPKVVVLSYEFWKRQYNADRGILGRKLVLSGDPYEVIGVMPETFTLFRGKIYVPLQRKLDPATRGNHFLPTYARLKQGISLERATKDIRAIGAAMAKEYGNDNGADLQSLTESVIGDVRTPLNVLMGGVSLLLLIACANVANLLLTSGQARRRELAVRMALGAGPRQLARQLTTEGILLSLVGGALGVPLAQFIVRVFLALATDQLPRRTAIQIDGYVLAFTAIISIVVGIVCSLWPIMMLYRSDLAHAVREGDVRSSNSGKKVGNALVVAEVALAFGLLVGSGLLIKNLLLLRGRDTGFRTDRIVTFRVTPSGLRYRSNAAVTDFWREFYSRITQVDGVESAGFTSHLPMYEWGWNGYFNIEGGTPWDSKHAPLVEYRWFYGDYMKTLGVPLLKGRLLDTRDGQGTNTVLINKAMADTFWPNKDPIGRKFGPDDNVKNWHEVVGVIGNIRSAGLENKSLYEFYQNIEQSALGRMTVAIRTKGEDPKAIMPTMRQILASIDSSLPITEIQTLEDVVSDSVGQPRLMSALTGLFGGLAGLLAVVGIYSIMAYNVRRQRREFGVRMAMGAERGDVTKLVISRGLILSGLGVAIGATGALFFTRLLKTMLHDVTTTDPIVFIGTALTVLIVGMLASYLPAHSAARVDPMIVLRTE